MTTRTNTTRAGVTARQRVGGMVSAAAAAALGMTFAAGGAESKPMLALDERLELRPVQFAGASQTAIFEVDTRGHVQAEPTGDALALLPPSFEQAAKETATPASAAPGPSPEQPANAPWVALVDGQRIVGQPHDAGAQEDALAWQHETLGPLVFRLERIMRINFDPQPGETAVPLEPPGADDVVVLRNGDRLTGFVVSVQPQIEIESDDGIVTIPIDRVARIDLVNERVPARGIHLWLTDGSRIGVHSLAEPENDVREGGLDVYLDSPSESPLSEPTDIPLHDVTAIAFEAGRLTALTDLPMAEHEPDQTRRTGEPPLLQRGGAEPLGAGDVLLPGPMSVEWPLPDSVMRLAGWMTLPESSFVWGDCEVVIETLDGDGAAQEIVRSRLRSVTPTVRINESLPAGAKHLRVRVEPGEYGPIQDRVILQRFILLTQP